MDENRAIPTHWDGRAFRSRIEARWAVFLNRLKLKYEYEPEGFRTPAGPYLPDFYVPAWETWIEIKPANLHSDIAKPVALAGCSDCRIMVAYGAPRPNMPVAIISNDVVLAEMEIVCLTESRFPAMMLRRDGWHSLWAPGENPFPGNLLFYETYESKSGCRYAYDAASSARFEHGESPEVW